jgi:5-methyltetrahydrofolate--homocysteine methyltransferase
MNNILEQITESLIKGKANDVKALVQKALDEQINPAEILNNALLAGMSVIGERFKNNEVYVPEVLIAARAMKAGMEILKPVLTSEGVDPLGTVVMGTVKGDLHDIGKNLVCMMLEGGGFRVVDAGINVEPSKLIELAVENNAAIIGASALLTTTMVNMKDVVESVKAAGLSGKVKVMIGGAPVTQAFADEIGADGYSADAASAVDLAKALIQK